MNRFNPRLPLVRCALVLGVWLALTLVVSRAASEEGVRFTPSARHVDTYEFLEVTLEVAAPPAGNPFKDVAVTGEFAGEDGVRRKVDGFCDAEDGGVLRIRFMPTQPGRHVYSVTYEAGGIEKTSRGTFTAHRGGNRGLVRVDKAHPFHFVYEGTGKHYFWNATTTYALMGWRDEAVIRESIDRLAKLKVNRLRVAIIPPRVKGGLQWFEPTVTNDAHFTFCVNAWPAARPESVDDPGFDTSRFNLEHWRKYERLLAHALKRDMIVSVIFYVDGRLPGVDPFRKEGMGGADERRYYRYAVARLAPFANVMWDVSNEYRLFRTDAWAEQMGAFLKECDPYDHLTSVHGHGTFNFRLSPWVDFAMYQSWDEHGAYAFMLKNRQEQLRLGRPLPQVNEEYGYEDHYPGPWGEGRKWPARIAESRRRLAWEMTMAGGYQTTGERANVPGYGGWINGRGSDEMIMLKGYARMREFFEEMEWWKLEPAPDVLAGGTAHVLARSGVSYVLYLPKGGSVAVKLAAGKYKARWFNPRTGRSSRIGTVTTDAWISPSAPDQEDWVLYLVAG